MQLAVPAEGLPCSALVGPWGEVRPRSPAAVRTGRRVLLRPVSRSNTFPGGTPPLFTSFTCLLLLFSSTENRNYRRGFPRVSLRLADFCVWTQLLLRVVWGQIM